MSREEGEGVEKHCTNVFTLMAWGGFLNKNKLIQIKTTSTNYIYFLIIGPRQTSIYIYIRDVLINSNKDIRVSASGFSNFSRSEIELKIMTEDDRKNKNKFLIDNHHKKDEQFS